MKVLKNITSKLLVSAIVASGAIAMSTMSASAATTTYIRGDETNVTFQSLSNEHTPSSSINISNGASLGVSDHKVMKLSYHLDGSDANGGYAAATITAPYKMYFNNKNQALGFKYFNPNMSQSLYLKISGPVYDRIIPLNFTMKGWEIVKLDAAASIHSLFNSVTVTIMGQSGKNQDGSIYLSDISVTDDEYFGYAWVDASPNNANKGTVTGGNRYVKPSGMVVLNATAKSGYTFIGWSKDRAVYSGGTICSTNPTLIISNVQKDVKYVANFK